MEKTCKQISDARDAKVTSNIVKGEKIQPPVRLKLRLVDSPARHIDTFPDAKNPLTDLNSNGHILSKGQFCSALYVSIQVYHLVVEKYSETGCFSGKFPAQHLDSWKVLDALMFANDTRFKKQQDVIAKAIRVYPDISFRLNTEGYIACPRTFCWHIGVTINSFMYCIRQFADGRPKGRLNNLKFPKENTSSHIVFMALIKSNDSRFTYRQCEF